MLAGRFPPFQDRIFSPCLRLVFFFPSAAVGLCGRPDGLQMAAGTPPLGSPPPSGSESFLSPDIGEGSRTSGESLDSLGVF